MLPEEVWQLGKWQWLTAWLPSDAAGPIPSEERIAPLGPVRQKEVPMGDLERPFPALQRLYYSYK